MNQENKRAYSALLVSVVSVALNFIFGLMK